MGLQQTLDEETVGAVPMRQAIAVETGTVVRAAVARMRSTDLGCAVVINSRGKPIGLFTERCLLRLLTEDASLDDSPVGEFAEFDCPVVKQSEPLSSLWQKIQRDGARFVCVTDENDQLMGVTGQRGLSEYLSECFPREVMVQRIGGTPWMQEREGA